MLFAGDYQKYKPFSSMIPKHIPCLSLGYSNNGPQSMWLISKKNYFTHFCRWKSESRVPAVSSSTENPLLVSNCQLLVVFSRGRKRARKLSGVPFIRALISLRLNFHDLTTSQRSYLLVPSQCELGFQVMIFGRDTNIQSLVPFLTKTMKW